LSFCIALHKLPIHGCSLEFALSIGRWWWCFSHKASSWLMTGPERQVMMPEKLNHPGLGDWTNMIRRLGQTWLGDWTRMIRRLGQAWLGEAVMSKHQIKPVSLC
jgi:hypothetical protein